MQVLLFPPAVAVIVVEPTFKGLTVPPETDATEVFELDHFTVLSVAFVGFTVAVILYESPI